MRTVFIQSDSGFNRIYGPPVLERIREVTTLLGGPFFPDEAGGLPPVCAEAEVVFSGWGCPRFDANVLAQVPNLKLLLYGAGSVKGVVCDDFWKANIPLCSAWQVNAIPVMEFTLAAITLSTKRVFHHQRFAHSRKAFDHEGKQVEGMYATTIGLVSLGAIGRMVAERLRAFEVDVIAYDPFADPLDAESLGVTLASLDQVFATSDVVSIHTPWLPETEGMFREEHFAAMKPGATLINTGRGATVNEGDLCAVLARRPDLQAILDVTQPEPPGEGSPLWELPNVFLTPHLAGAMGRECWRMGMTMVDELQRFERGQPLLHQVTEARFARMA